jgi:hypothetical protein
VRVVGTSGRRNTATNRLSRNGASVPASDWSPPRRFPNADAH